MEIKEIILDGRKYKAYVSPDEQEGAFIIIGPPEHMTDSLGLPEPFATKLHNILYDRGVFKYEDACRKNVLVGVLQELYSIDVQILLEEFLNYEKESVGGSL